MGTKGKRTPISLGKRLALQLLATWLVACTALSCVYKFETVTYHTDRMDAISPYMMPCSSLHVLFTQNGYLTNIPRLHKEDFPRHYGAFICILLMLAGDVEINPGPAAASVYPCGVCELGVNWSRAAVCCDACRVWFHKTCVSMDTEVYDNIASRSWECYACGSHTAAPSYTMPTA